MRETQRRLLGVMDIVSSTRIALSLGPHKELEFKKEFTELISGLARSRRVQLISSTGDGFIFTPARLDERSESETLIDLIGFCGDSVTAFAKLLESIEICPHSSGLRFGLSDSEVAIEWSSGHVHLGGAAVSLVTRLCSIAEPGEIVLDEDLGKSIHRQRLPLIMRRRLHKRLRGFANPVLAFHSLVPIDKQCFETVVKVNHLLLRAA